MKRVRKDFLSQISLHKKFQQNSQNIFLKKLQLFWFVPFSGKLSDLGEVCEKIGK